jgi:hypothetical protein
MIALDVVSMFYLFTFFERCLRKQFVVSTEDKAMHKKRKRKK